MKKLDRSLGLVSVVAVSISAMIGSGIFVLPGMAIGLAGHDAWLAYVIAAVAVLPAALSKSELATAMPTSGGSYVFLDRCYGPLWGSVGGVALWLSLLLKSAFALVGMGAYLAVLTDLPASAAIFAVLAAIVVLNVLGVRKVSKALVVIATITVVSLAGLIAASFMRFEPANFDLPLPAGPIGVFAAAGLVFASFNGVTKVASIAEEIERPERNLPRGILLSLVLVTVLYSLVVFVLVGALPASSLDGDIRPIHTLAEALGGPWLGKAAGALGVLTLASMANAGLLAASRYPFAMSRGSVVPSLFGRLHASFATPIASVLVTGVVMALVIAFLDVQAIAKLASATVLSIFAAENVAVIVFRESRASWYRPRWRSPLYPWTQIAGVVSACALLFLLGTTAVVGIVASVVPGLLLFLFYGRTRARRRGLLSMLSRRSDLEADRRSSVPPIAPPDDEPEDHAAVVVALLGVERSPEILAELGGVLAEGGVTAVVDVQQLHDETVVDDALQDDGRVLSLKRRIAAAGEAVGSVLRFQVLLTRDPPGTLDRVSSHFACRWLVMAWQTRERFLLPYNPLGWMLDHLDTNLALFRDRGVRYVSEILALSEGDDLDPLVLQTADHLASVWDATVTIARWLPDGASEADMVRAQASLVRIGEGLERPVRTRVLSSRDEVEALAEESARYDLLLLSRERTTLSRAFIGKTRHERIATASACSVLLLQPPMVLARRP